MGKAEGKENATVAHGRISHPWKHVRDLQGPAGVNWNSADMQLPLQALKIPSKETCTHIWKYIPMLEPNMHMEINIIPWLRASAIKHL